MSSIASSGPFRPLFPLCCGFLLFFPPRALAFTNGVTSKEFSAGGGCNDCHSGGTAPLVSFSGPTLAMPGQTVTITFTVNGTASQNGAGFNISAATGTLSKGDTGATKEAINPENGLVEITHVSPATVTPASFTFQWTAPEAFTEANLTGWGNAVNLDTKTSGDRAASAVHTISVCADDDGDGYRAEICGGDDCNDGDGSSHPDAEETCGDGIDQDCSGADVECGNDDDQTPEEDDVTGTTPPGDDDASSGDEGPTPGATPAGGDDTSDDDDETGGETFGDDETIDSGGCACNQKEPPPPGDIGVVFLGLIALNLLARRSFGHRFVNSRSMGLRPLPEAGTREEKK